MGLEPITHRLKVYCANPVAPREHNFFDKWLSYHNDESNLLFTMFMFNVHSFLFFLHFVGHSRIELLFTEWKSVVLAARRMPHILISNNYFIVYKNRANSNNFANIIFNFLISKFIFSFYSKIMPTLTGELKLLLILGHMIR